MTLRKSPWLGYAAAWAAAGAYNFCRDVFAMPLDRLAVFNLAHFGIWALLGLLAVPLMRRHPVGRRWQPWALHAAAGAVFTQVDITAGHWLYFHAFGLGRGMGLPEVAACAFRSCFHLGFTTYWGLLAVVQALDGQRRARAQALQLGEQRAALAQAQLQALRSQLQPHFLFNSLHTVSALMHYDVPAADRVLNRLGEVLRASLRSGDCASVPLHRELAFLRAYLEIEQVRFEQRLQVQWAVPEGLYDEPVPPFILQPLVENAIKHGVAPRADGGAIVVRAYRQHDALVLEVENDGPAAAPPAPGFGIGLGNTRARLEALYGQGGRYLELLRQELATIARVRVPRPAGAP
jgi:hypothetical protein